jgi:hypothetical protein
MGHLSKGGKIIMSVILEIFKESDFKKIYSKCQDDLLESDEVLEMWESGVQASAQLSMGNAYNLYSVLDKCQILKIDDDTYLFEAAYRSSMKDLRKISENQQDQETYDIWKKIIDVLDSSVEPDENICLFIS